MIIKSDDKGSVQDQKVKILVSPFLLTHCSTQRNHTPTVLDNKKRRK